MVNNELQKPELRPVEQYTFFRMPTGRWSMNWLWVVKSKENSESITIGRTLSIPSIKKLQRYCSSHGEYEALQNKDLIHEQLQFSNQELQYLPCASSNFHTSIFKLSEHSCKKTVYKTKVETITFSLKGGHHSLCLCATRLNNHMISGILRVCASSNIDTSVHTTSKSF